MASSKNQKSDVSIAKLAEQAERSEVAPLSSSSSGQCKSQSVESSGNKENIFMNDAPKSIFACKNFLVNDMNDAPESSIVASDKKDEHDTIFISSENNIDADTGNTVDSCIPMEGMQFDNEDDAYNFYNDYALRHGFSVRRSSWDKNAQGITVRKTFVCSKEGWKNSSGNPTTRKPDTRCGCPARMVLRRLPNGKYFVRTFICDHNHPLASPSTSHLLRSHRKVTSSRSATSKLANNANIAPKKTYKHLVKLLASNAFGGSSVDKACATYSYYSGSSNILATVPY
ncbi:FAR1-RELATED SEQUENCE 5 protein [Nymphaea thermarum]|nr:FAR1-RELATED SEQUENCE 5 protein [Nymphaea thermarum]